MCLNDKEIITSIEYSEQAKDYRDSLKYKGVDTDIMQKIMDKAVKEQQDRLDKMLRNAYIKGREDMKQEIIKLINGEQHRQNGYDDYGKQVLKDIRQLIKEIK